MIEPRVTMIAWPSELDRLATIIWQVSKTDEKMELNCTSNLNLVSKLIDEMVPVLRHFYFTFVIENMTISFREQLVRGVHDHYWIQSGRIMRYNINTLQKPKPVDDQDWQFYIESLHVIVEDMYRNAQPAETYRDIMPLGTLHRGIWTANLESLIHRFRKRSCWVAQGDKWIPVLTQVREQLRNVGFKWAMELAVPPCMNKNWEFVTCRIRETMLDRIRGTDPLSVCPIFKRHAIFKDPVPLEKLPTTEQVRTFEDFWGKVL